MACFSFYAKKNMIARRTRLAELYYEMFLKRLDSFSWCSPSAEIGATKGATCRVQTLYLMQGE
jgi:hypothetical protein